MKASNFLKMKALMNTTGAPSNGGGKVDGMPYVEKKTVEETRILYSSEALPVDSFWEKLYANRQTARYSLKDEVFHFVRDYATEVIVPPNIIAWEVASEMRACSVLLDIGLNTIILIPGTLDGPPPTDVIDGLDITIPIETEVVHKLDEKFIPERGEMVVRLEHYSDIMYFYDCTFADIRNAYLKGYAVYVTGVTNALTLSLIQCTDRMALFITLAGSRLWRCTIYSDHNQCSAWYTDL